MATHISSLLLRVLPLIGCVTALLPACYDDCEHPGEVRCAGSTVEICGKYSSEYPEWAPTIDCSDFNATCSPAEPGFGDEHYCSVPEVLCGPEKVRLCYDGHIVRCEIEGEHARLLQLCTYGCVDTASSPYCRDAPALDGGSDTGAR